MYWIKHKLSFGSHVRVVSGLLIICCIFYVSTLEDQKYKNWKREYLGLYQSYLDVEYYCHISYQRKLVKRNDADFRIVRRNRQYGFQPSFKPSAADIKKIDMRDLIQLRSFMIKYGVRIIILPYYKAGWTQLIFLMKSKDFKYVYGNTHYILFFLTEVDDIA
jgi:hypothetical protein